MKTRMKKQNFQEMWDDFKRCNICIMGIPERKARKEQKKHWKDNV